jgi:4-hydroxy-tetrahydrodipicolinate synthase
MAYDIAQIHGIVPPILTPLTEGGEVDFGSFTRLIEHEITGGVHGLFVLGSTGEVIFHDRQTRRRILEHAVKVVGGRVPVLAGVLDPATDRVIANARDAASIGVDAVVVTVPFYTISSPAEDIDHFRTVAKACPVPVVAYDIPICVHVKLPRSTVVTLAREGTIVGLKDSSGDDANLREVLLDLKGTKVWCLTGAELVVDSALLMGAQGAVPGLANIDPAAFVRLYDATRRGDWEAARTEQERICRLKEIARCGLPRASWGGATFSGYKTALQAMGIIATNVPARPQRALNEEEAAKVRAILRECGLLG